MKTFGPYTKLSRLGAGGTAEVWLASGPHPRGEELLALKIVLPHRADDPALREMLEGEARTAERLKHPHIAEVFHIGEEEGLPYLAMEYVRGWTLSALTKRLAERGERLSLAEACLIIHDAALGLHYAHEATGAEGRPLGLVHRDVSPQNLMACEDGHSKVLDFGLAKATAETGTKTGGIKGKIAYMPPEQIESVAIDRRVDVFALGAVLFELVCGRPLYPGRNEAELLQQAFFLPQTHPLLLAPDLPESLVDVLVAAIARNKQDRLPDAFTLAQAVEPFITEDAQEALAVRLESYFGLLPRTAGEVLGLPPTPVQHAPAPRPSAPLPPPVRTRTPRPIRARVARPATARHDTPVELPAIRRPAFGEGDEEFSVTDADVRPPRPSRTPKLLALAAVIVLAVGGAFAAPLLTPQAQVFFENALAKLQAQTESAPESAPPPEAPVPTRREPEKRAGSTVKRPPGVVLVQSNKPALVMEDGKELGSTPLKLTRPAGKRRLEVFTADGRTARVLDVEIVSGKEVVADVAFQ